MKKSKAGQYVTVNAVALLIFALAVVVYILFSSYFAFLGVAGLGIVYAILANGMVMFSGSGGSSEDALWRQHFPEEIGILERAKLSLESRAEYFNTLSDSKLTAAYNKTLKRVNDDMEEAKKFLLTYDFVNRPGDNGRLMAIANDAQTAVTNLNEFIDDSYDSDGGAGDEIDRHIRKIKRMRGSFGQDQQRGINDLIESLEEVSDILHKRPDTADEFRKLFSYYLPTLEKLLDKYSQFVGSGESGPNVSEALGDIREVIADMPGAIKIMTDNVYRADAFDIKAEKNVMGQMMERDGIMRG